MATVKLRDAIKAHDIDEVARLLGDPDVRVNLDSWGEFDDAPLHWAMKMKAPIKIVEMLLDADADPNVLDNTDKTPLFWTLYQDDDEYDALGVSKLMLSRGASVNVKDAYQHTLLYDILYNRKQQNAYDIVKLFLESGEDPAITISTGVLRGGVSKISLLEIALLQVWNPDIAKLLLFYGANPNVPSYSGEIGESVFRSYLIQIKLGSSPQQLDMVNVMLDHGASLEPTGHLQQTPLQLIIGLDVIGFDVRNIDLVELLLDYGVNINHRDALSDTALTSAIRSNESQQLIKLLLNHGADTCVPFLLDCAIPQRNPIIIEMLIAHGIPLDRADTSPYIGFTITSEAEREITRILQREWDDRQRILSARASLAEQAALRLIRDKTIEDEWIWKELYAIRPMLVPTVLNVWRALGKGNALAISERYNPQSPFYNPDGGIKHKAAKRQRPPGAHMFASAAHQELLDFIAEVDALQSPTRALYY